MVNQIIINSGIKEKRAAILMDNVLEDIVIELDSYKKIVGNVYRARVIDVLPGMQAAFVDIGYDKNAFLHVSDIYPLLDEKQLKLKKEGKLGIQHVLQPGQELMVQVVKEPIYEKGAKVTCKISLPGRYLVLLPGEYRTAISRKIKDFDERDRLKKIVGKLKDPDMGLIIRTNSRYKKADLLELDYSYLKRTWTQIKENYNNSKAPDLIYEHASLLKTIVRDYLNKDVDKVLIDDESDYRVLLELSEKLAPDLKNRINLYNKKMPIFHVYGIEKELERAIRKKIWLDSGGFIVIEQTEALVAIDVNTGKYTGKKNAARTILKTNLEAAREIARQLRLRDIGGIIIIDFIDMKERRHQQEVLETFEKELAKDRSVTSIQGLTKLGLLEMTRQKVREGLGELMQKECSYCRGKGLILSANSVAESIIRNIQLKKASEEFSRAVVECHPLVVSSLKGDNGEVLQKIFKKTGVSLELKPVNSLHIEKYRINITG
ncbi:Rne/Rng family ribonuclease [Halothermothrix orenii]|uniref:Ribonuclease G n=1 Tax=Halothermothrix orenii (strain H 168 / OCM 544 / DSM 9562) TaxID=373903 RepID=B8CXZ3_HALOH|nr:Rne/Rng family ribonuclease [Halothermothrix orenii]ACL70162.1 ribonuclease, Rne/Rng family [Halothermothrix orenii H 168]